MRVTKRRVYAIFLVLWICSLSISRLHHSSSPNFNDFSPKPSFIIDRTPNHTLILTEDFEDDTLEEIPNNWTIITNYPLDHTEFKIKDEFQTNFTFGTGQFLLVKDHQYSQQAEMYRNLSVNLTRGFIKTDFWHTGGSYNQGRIELILADEQGTELIAVAFVAEPDDLWHFEFQGELYNISYSFGGDPQPMAIYFDEGLVDLHVNGTALFTDLEYVNEPISQIRIKTDMSGHATDLCLDNMEFYEVVPNTAFNFDLYRFFLIVVIIAMSFMFFKSGSFTLTKSKKIVQKRRIRRKYQLKYKNFKEVSPQFTGIYSSDPFSLPSKRKKFLKRLKTNLGILNFSIEELSDYDFLKSLDNKSVLQNLKEG